MKLHHFYMGWMRVFSKRFLEHFFSRFIQRIMNNQVNKRTGVSPSQMIFGNSVNHDSHFLTEPTNNDLDKSSKEYMENLLSIQAKIVKIAQDNQE